MEKNYNVKEVVHPLTGDLMWMIDDVSLPLGGIKFLLEEFIRKNNHPDYTLSIYDNMTENIIEIDCHKSEMPQIVDYIYHLEKGSPLTFIGVNSSSDSYIVGMSISRGRVDFGNYRTENGKLIKI